MTRKVPIVTIDFHFLCSTNKIMSDDWVLYYYGGFPGRGEFIRLIFEEAGVKYREVNEYKTLRSQINQGEGDFFPHFAPPMIKNGNLLKYSLSLNIHCIYMYILKAITPLIAFYRRV